MDRITTEQVGMVVGIENNGVSSKETFGYLNTDFTEGKYGGGGRMWTCNFRVMNPSGIVLFHLLRSNPDLWYSLIINSKIDSLFGQMWQLVSLIYP